MGTNQTVSKPFAGFEDHDACVRDNQDKEDPDAFCAWLKDHAKDALSDPNAEQVLTELTTEFVSSVDRPAQDSEWLIFKDADTPRRTAAEAERPYVFPTDGEPCGSCVKGEDPCQDGWVMVGMKPNPNGSGEVPNCVPEDDVDDPPNIESELPGLPDDFDPDEWRNRSKAADVDVRAENGDGERQIAYAAVLIPNEVDKQGDVIPPYVVERSAHEYMAEYRKMDSDHDLDDGAGVPVESWILKEEQEFDTPDGGTVTYPEGTWVIGKRFVDEEWKRVKAGELTGFSIYGGAEAVGVSDLVDDVKSANRRAKGVDANGARSNHDMKNALEAAYTSDTPPATLVDRVQDGVSKAEIPDEDAAMVVDLLRESASMLEDSMGGGDDGGDESPPGAEADDAEDDVESSKDQPDDAPTDTNENMTNDDTPDGGDSNDGTNDGTDDGDVADGIDELKSMVKGVDDKVDDFDDRLTDVEDEVDALKSAVGDDVDSDRMDTGDVDDDVPENERMKSVAKEAANEAVAAVAGVDDADDPEVVRKGLREQVGAGDDDSVDSDLPDEDYSGVVDDANDTGVSKSEDGGSHGNKRLVGGDD